MYRNLILPNERYQRFGFAAPFLVGALTGGAAVSIFNPYRPRPNYYYPYYY